MPYWTLWSTGAGRSHPSTTAMVHRMGCGIGFSENLGGFLGADGGGGGPGGVVVRGPWGGAVGGR
jgi:hypothetical protein